MLYRVRNNYYQFEMPDVCVCSQKGQKRKIMKPFCIGGGQHGCLLVYIASYGFLFKYYIMF